MLESPIPWHRYFGLFLDDFFRGTPYTVEMEIDLSKKLQLLDIVVVRKLPGELHKALPDGLENLGLYNLISFKSFLDDFDQWTLNELIGHYVNYRKQISPSLKKLLPESDFRLYGVCVKYPKSLVARGDFRKVSPGVYDVPNGLQNIRLLVISQMPESDANAMLQVFSAKPEKRRSAAKKVAIHSKETSTLLQQMLEQLIAGETKMPYTRADFDREYKEYFKRVYLPMYTPEERVEGMSAEERMKGLPAEERLKGLSPDDIRKLFEAFSHSPQ